MEREENQINTLPEGWNSESFIDTLEKFGIERTKQVPANAYLSTGKYPIVDQGQELITGWTNDESAVIKDGLPLIIFGDHTRILKYVDFPFAIGADGTKLIKPQDRFDTRYFYYYLLSLDIPSKGYSRHFKTLKEKKISYPSLPEQKKIAGVLYEIQKAIEVQDEIIKKTQELKKSTMQQLFSHISDGWNLEPFTDVLEDFRIERTKQVPANAYLLTGKYPIIDQGQELIAGWTNDESTIINDDLPLIIFGDHTRIFKYVDFPFAIGADGTKLIKPQNRFDTRYFYYYLLSLDIPSKGYSRHFKVLKEKDISYPSLPEQKKIAGVLDSVDNKISIHNSKKKYLQELFNSMLNKLMNGEINIKAINLISLEVN